MKIRARVKAHTAKVTALAFAPDGKTLVSGGEDASLAWVDVAKKKVVARTPLGEFNPHPLSLAPISSEDVWLTKFPYPRARVQHYGKTGLMAELGKSHLAFAQVRVAKNRRVALSGGTKKGLFVWDVATSKTTGVLPGLRGASDSFELSPDGTRAVTLGYNDHRLTCWELESCKAQWWVDTSSSGAVAWSPDGRTVIECADELIARSSETGAKRWSQPQVQGAAFLSWPAKDRIIALSRSRVSALRGRDGEELEGLELRATAFAATEDVLAVGSEEGIVSLIW